MAKSSVQFKIYPRGEFTRIVSLRRWDLDEYAHTIAFYGTLDLRANQASVTITIIKRRQTIRYQQFRINNLGYAHRMPNM